MDTPQCYIDLMKRCWDDDPLKRPSASEVLDIIKKWIFYSYDNKINEELKRKMNEEELKRNIMDIKEFINAPIGFGYDDFSDQSDSEACYTSRLLNFTSKDLNGILEGSLKLKFLQKDKSVEKQLFKLERIAETYYQSSQNELKEKQFAYQNIQMELINLQQRNSQFEQDNQNLEFNLTVQTEEFAEKENTLQVQITNLQNEKQALANNLAKQLEQNELTTQQFQNQINRLNQEKNSLQDQLIQKETNIQELKDQYENQLIQSQNNHKQMKDENLQLEKVAKTYYQSSQNELKEIQIELQQSKKENDNLYQKNVKLVNQLENLFHQNALPNNELSNYQLGDSNQSYGMDLYNDISILNYSLEKYITDLNQDVIINIEEIKKLLLVYECSTKISSQKDDQLLIQAVLQRYIIETIISHATGYFKSSGQHYHLESDIIKEASSLSKLLINISKYRTGNDKITHAALTKLRKQIYLVLNNCGFANVYGENNTTYEHPFIADCKKKLNNIMNGLRVVVKDQEKIAVENLAATIILDKIFMEKNNLEDIDDEENMYMYVDLCYFPLIGKDLTSDDQKVYIPAKVIVRKI
ncbi:kinase-like domain-containing protein [Rhizophagus clarus]|uniref:Kinase-like domain-containing protein n=1 Tax=Rhizophagus clarus TaxID=94130 RepID=A0A8H3MHK2_9GLOM|nr:kinase-like domain-containing protein [Rhizophagus clarus]